MKDGIFQIPVEEKDKEKTTFYTGNKLMQFKKMPQGYKNSSAIFQRAMNIIFKDLIGESCLIYIDDILVYGKTKEEHDKNFNSILMKMEVHGLEENKLKRIQSQETVTFLGYEICKNKIKPALNRSQGILEFKAPKNKKELQRFIGLLNYDRIFISRMSEHMKRFYVSLEKEIVWKWNQEEEDLFNKIKEMWSKDLELLIPDLNKEFILETDASQIGLGACLIQSGKPVAFISRTLTKNEQNYGITEREVLGALWAMEKLRYFLEGRKFLLVTDHKAIEFIKTKLDFGSDRIMRWFNRFERFEFEVKYKPGKELIAADALSRSTLKDVNQMEKINESIKEKVLKIHAEFNHQKH